MTGTSLADLTAGTRQTIGRYFSVVSMLPSLLLVVYAFILVRSGAWSHPPDWTAALDAFFHIGVGGTVLLIVLGMALGLGAHPLQFSGSSKLTG